MKTIEAVNIKIYHKCARCGKEEDPEEITCKILQLITVNEGDRIEVEPLTSDNGECLK